MLGYGNKKNGHCMVKKIDNGYVIESCCDDEQTTEYVKSITKIPAVLDRILNIKGEKSKEDYDRMERKEEVEKSEDGKFGVK
jgi:hypothetical protein